MSNKKIFVAGHKGLVGSAICKILKKNKYTNILTIDRKKLDLTDQKKVFDFLKKNKPKYIIIAAALVGGISANNKYRADFIYNNTAIPNNVTTSMMALMLSLPESASTPSRLSGIPSPSSSISTVSQEVTPSGQLRSSGWVSPSVSK